MYTPKIIRHDESGDTSMTLIPTEQLSALANGLAFERLEAWRMENPEIRWWIMGGPILPLERKDGEA